MRRSEKAGSHLVQSRRTAETATRERGGYFAVHSASAVEEEFLYTVLHEAANPVARVLLVGPFAPERVHSYTNWVRWARFLAARGVEVLRFDYRGVGESTGSFEHLSFETWQADVLALSRWMKQRQPELPLYLHGLRFGALLAARCFALGEGDGLLLWAPPANANISMRPMVKKSVMELQLSQQPEERRPVSFYLRQLEAGEPLEVSGYCWSPGLWRSSFDFGMPPGMDNAETASERYSRPVRISSLDRQGATGVVGSGNLGFDSGKDFTWLYSGDLEWLLATLGTPVNGLA